MQSSMQKLATSLLKAGKSAAQLFGRGTPEPRLPITIKRFPTSLLENLFLWLPMPPYRLQPNCLLFP